MLSKQMSSTGDQSNKPFSFKRRSNFEHPISDSDSESESGATKKKPKLSGEQKSAANIGPDVRNVCTEVEGLYLTKVSCAATCPRDSGFAEFSLSDILSQNCGTLVESIQFNYMFEIDWLVRQYPKEFRSAPLTLVHGDQGSAKTDLDVEAMRHGHVTLVQARLPVPYGTHHSKMMLLRYTNGLRIVIHTANLIQLDWHQKTQCGWMTPLLSPMATDSASPSGSGDSATGFRADLMQYLTEYRHPKVVRWADLVGGFDFSGIRVFLIASCPGRHSSVALNKFGHMKLRKSLGQFTFDADNSAGTVAQFSSIGSLGRQPRAWLTGEFNDSLTAGGRFSLDGAGDNGESRLKLIYPSVDNVRSSLEGYPAGGSLPYRSSVAAQQPWLRAFLHRWSASPSNRTRAMPHMKSYGRYTIPCANRPATLSWYMVTSANLSKAAWGCLELGGTQLAIRSYEIGVLMVARMFGCDTFSTGLGHANSAAAPSDSGRVVIRVPYDLPPRPYERADSPWIVDQPCTKQPDSHGNIWCPQ